MARTTFDGPVRSRNGFEGDVIPNNPVQIPSYADEGSAPDPKDHANSLAIIGGVLQVSDGTVWAAVGAPVDGGEGG